MRSTAGRLCVVVALLATAVLGPTLSADPAAVPFVFKGIASLYAKPAQDGGQVDKVWLFLPKLGPDSASASFGLETPHKAALDVCTPAGCDRHQLDGHDVRVLNPAGPAVLTLNRTEISENAPPCMPTCASAEARSLRWLLNIDDLLRRAHAQPGDHPLWPELTDDTYQPAGGQPALTARFGFDRGEVYVGEICSDLVGVGPVDNEDRHGSRKVGCSVVVEVPVEDPLRLGLYDLRTGQQAEELAPIPLVAGLKVRVSHDPVLHPGHQDGPHFQGHYLLRKGHAGVQRWIPKLVGNGSPGTDAQCSPSENGGG